MAPSHVACAAQRGSICAHCGTALPWVQNAAVPPPPPEAVSCPLCQSPAQPGHGAQRCTQCNGQFALHAGTLLDQAVSPPTLDHRLPRIKVKSAGLLTYRMGLLEPQGVVEGTLDPVTGAIPMDSVGVLYADIFTVAIWRKVDVGRIVLAVLVPLLLAAMFATGLASSPWFALPTLFFLAIFGVMFYASVFVKKNFVRVAGRNRLFTIRFDRPIWKRRSFHDELLRRAGIPPQQIP